MQTDLSDDVEEITSFSTPEVHLLQSMVWPRSYDAGLPEPMCFRAFDRADWEFVAPACMRATGRKALSLLDLGTFFGAISLTTWCGPAGLDEIIVQVKIRGSCRLKIYTCNGHEERSVLWEKLIAGKDSVYDIPFKGLKNRRGVLYPVFETLKGTPFELLGLQYLTTAVPIREPRLAIVMPTFRRENYAQQNVELIHEHVLRPQGDRCRLFVVDNGGTLKLPTLNGVELIRNRNFGGAGGFARGVLRASDEGFDFTHVLFCDDDVLIEHQSISRLLSILRYVSEDTVVSGGMLRYSTRHVLHERNGNVYNMQLSSNRYERDIRDPGEVARYDELGYSSFCGWWFACYPMGSYKEKLLPCPFFIGWDDIEMGRRCNSLKLTSISLLGIGVWHEEFHKKDSNWRWFYHVRNGLATSLLYDRGKGGLRHAMSQIWTSLLTYRYERAEFMIDGLKDVITGWSSIREQAADELHVKLLAREKNKIRDVGHLVVPDKLDRPFKNTRWTRFLSKWTMNGHLLPIGMFKTAREPVDPGWVVEPLRRERKISVFRSRRVVYYEPTTGKGIVCEVDHGRFFRLLIPLLLRWARLRLNWKTIRDHWRAGHGEMSSPAFWRRYLGI